MFRKDLVPLLHNNPLRLSEVARLCGVPLKDVADDVRHLHRTLKKSAYRIAVTPAACRKCGFVFAADKLLKPGKCPQCRSTWLDEPVIQITDA